MLEIESMASLSSMDEGSSLTLLDLTLRDLLRAAEDSGRCDLPLWAGSDGGVMSSSMISCNHFLGHSDGDEIVTSSTSIVLFHGDVGCEGGGGEDLRPERELIDGGDEG